MFMFMSIILVYSTGGDSSIKYMLGLRCGNLMEYSVRNKKRKRKTKQHFELLFRSSIIISKFK